MPLRDDVNGLTLANDAIIIPKSIYVNLKIRFAPIIEL